MAEQVIGAKSAGLPPSLRGVLERLPSAEAVAIIDDLGKAEWVIDNNNNNNTHKKALLEDLQSMSKEELIKVIVEQQKTTM